MAKQALHVKRFQTEPWDWFNITEMFVINSIYKPWIPASHAIELGNRVLKTVTTKILRLAKAIKSIKYHYTMLLYFSQTPLLSDFFSKQLLLALPWKKQSNRTVNNSYQSSLLIPMEKTAGDLLSRKSQTTAHYLNSSVPEQSGTGSQ